VDLHVTLAVARIDHGSELHNAIDHIGVRAAQADVAGGDGNGHDLHHSWKMPLALFTLERKTLASSAVVVGCANTSRLRSLPKFKVFRPVVIALSVDVMDILFGF
jgi:hypothetical protein